MDLELALAIVALFAAGTALGVHASNYSWPSISDAATVLGQGSLVAQRGINPNIAPEWNRAEQARRLIDAEAQHVENVLRWEEACRIESTRVMAFNASVPAQNAWIYAKNQAQLGNYAPQFIIDRGWVNAAAHEAYAAPLPPPVHPARPVRVDPVSPMAAPSLAILTATITFIELGVSPLFGPPFGFGEGPNWGDDLNSSISNFTAGYDDLTKATPAVTDWYSLASQDYTIDTQALQLVAAQAGIDSLLTTAITESQSLDSQLKEWISTQALGVEILQCCIASMGVGLVLCETIALTMEASLGLGASRWFQMWAAATFVSGAGGVIIAMLSWSDGFKNKFNSVANAYDDLIAQIPSSVPSESPYKTTSAGGSTTPWFGDVNLSDIPDESASPAATNGPGRHHAGPHAPTDFGDRFSHTPPTELTKQKQDTSTPETPQTLAEPSVPSQPQTVTPHVPQRGNAVSQDMPSRPQPSPETWADMRPKAAASTKAALPLQDVDDTEGSAAAGTAEAERVPVGVAALYSDQATAAKPDETRRVLPPVNPSQERKE